MRSINLSNLNSPLDSNSSYDPLDPAGSASRGNATSSSVDVASNQYKSGQWVETSMDNSAFFNSIPRGNAQANKVLKAGTPLKVISMKGAYVKVRLESGAVGYVPEIMVAEQAASMSGDSSLGSAPDFPPVAPIDPETLQAPVPDFVVPDGDAPSFTLPDSPAAVNEPAVLPENVAPEPEIPSLEESGDLPPAPPAPPNVPGVSPAPE